MLMDYIGKPMMEWFAVRTRSNREAVVAEALEGKGLEVWCPRYKAPPFRSDGILKPLFPGYLFCRFNAYDRLPVLIVPGVVNIVSNGRVPLPIDDREIESLRIVLRSMMPVTPQEYLSVGDPVRITEGPLAGAEGHIVQHQPDRLIVSITLLQRSVSVAVQVDWLEKVRRAA
jgi:transcriptional antiterminator NusG